MYALIRTAEGTRYGTIASRHRTEDAAEIARGRRCRAVSKRFKSSLTRLMYEVCELPTPAGDDGKVGDRVAIDFSR